MQQKYNSNDGNFIEDNILKKENNNVFIELIRRRLVGFDPPVN